VLTAEERNLDPQILRIAVQTLFCYTFVEALQPDIQPTASVVTIEIVDTI